MRKFGKVTTCSSAVATHIVWPDHLLDVAHGALEIDAIASIGCALDSARRVAVRRLIPHVVLDDHPGNIRDLDQIVPTRSPVPRVDTCWASDVIALRSVELLPAGTRQSRCVTSAAPVTPTSSLPSAGHRMKYSGRSLLLIDRYAVRVRDHTIVTVQRQDAGLVEYRAPINVRYT